MSIIESVQYRCVGPAFRDRSILGSIRGVPQRAHETLGCSPVWRQRALEGNEVVVLWPREYGHVAEGRAFISSFVNNFFTVEAHNER